MSSLGDIIVQILSQASILRDFKGKITDIKTLIDPEQKHTQHDDMWDSDADLAWKYWVADHEEELKSLGAEKGLDGLFPKELIDSIVSLSGDSYLDRAHDLVTNKIDSAPSKNQNTSNEEMIISSAYPKSSHFAHKIVSVAKNIGANPFDLANLINFETAGSFKASTVNSLGYTGLIQFGNSAASDLGTTTSHLRGLPEEEQMEYVEDYLNLSHKRRGANYSRPEELFMAVFYPSSIDKSTGKIQPGYKFPQKVIDANNGIDTPQEYVRRALKNAKINSSGNIL